MSYRESKVAEQLSLFGLKPTARMREQPAGQIVIDILEITESPKQFIREERK